MHPSAMTFVAELARGFLPGGAILEVGSYNENGTVRDLFPDADPYVGVDVRPGPGVDRVIEGLEPYPFPDDSFDLVVSTEMLEHDLRPWHTVAEMRRVVRPDGWVVLTARGYDERGCYPIHDWRDCWRFTPLGMLELLTWAGLDRPFVQPDPDEPGVFAIGRKPV